MNGMLVGKKKYKADIEGDVMKKVTCILNCESASDRTNIRHCLPPPPFEMEVAKYYFNGRLMDMFVS